MSGNCGDTAFNHAATSGPPFTVRALKPTFNSLERHDISLDYPRYSQLPNSSLANPPRTASISRKWRIVSASIWILFGLPRQRFTIRDTDAGLARHSCGKRSGERIGVIGCLQLHEECHREKYLSPMDNEVDRTRNDRWIIDVTVGRRFRHKNNALGSLKILLRGSSFRRNLIAQASVYPLNVWIMFLAAGSRKDVF